jgi:hypothetical protein
MAAVRSIASGISDASSRSEPPAFSRRDLEDGADVRSREEHTVRRQANDRDDAVIAIQEHGVDGEPHPERMHRTGTFQQESFVRLEFRPTQESPRALPQRLRDPHAPWTEAHLLHDGSVAATADISRPLIPGFERPHAQSTLVSL